MKIFQLKNRKVASMPVQEIPKIGDHAWNRYMGGEYYTMCDAVIPHVTEDGQLIYECHYTGIQGISVTNYYHQEGVTVI